MEPKSHGVELVEIAVDSEADDRASAVPIVGEGFTTVRGCNICNDGQTKS